MKKLSKKMIKKLKPFWEKAQEAKMDYYDALNEIEEEMAESTGIKDIEFFFSDDGLCGIGNVSRTIKLIMEDQNGDLKST